MSKGSGRRKEDIKKIWNNWADIDWSKKSDKKLDKQIYTHYCPQCNAPHIAGIDDLLLECHICGWEQE